MDSVKAEEEFSWGVRAYHKGFFNKAIINFEKALSYKSEKALYKEWLGFAYFKSGFNEAALNVWETLIKANEAPAVLIETVNLMKLGKIEEYNPEEIRYIESFNINGIKEEYNLFLRPSCVAASDDGSYYMASYGSNEVLKFDINGNIIDRISGGLGGFNRPFDLYLAPSGLFYVTEYGGNKISVFNEKGRIIDKFGTRGLGDGEMLGPQYICSDADNYIYVSDWGNKRISKFDSKGNFVFYFGDGSKNRNIQKLKGPSGLVSFNSKIFVADKVLNKIYVYDKNGNFLKSFGESYLDSPEGMSLYNSRQIMISDSKGLLLYDIEKDSFRNIYKKAKDSELNLKTVKDINGNLVSPDFNNNELKILSSFSSMYSGLFVKIDRIVADHFPKVTVELEVRDSIGNPVVGLNASNFILSENGLKVNDPRIVFQGYKSETVDVVFVIELSGEMKSRFREIESTLADMIASFKGNDNFEIIIAGPNPVKINSKKNYIKEIHKVFDEVNDHGFQFDNAVKMAVSELNDTKFNRAVFYLGNGSLHSNAFENVNHVDLAQLLNNNGISFNNIFMDRKESSRELDYLSTETRGRNIYYYIPEGLKGIIEDLRAEKNPYYVFSYKSSLPTDFGRKYLPFEAECILLSKSGKNDSGYFAPLEY